MTAYSRRFRLTNERAVVGRVVFLDRGQVGVVKEVVDAPHPLFQDTTLKNVTVAFGVKGKRVKTYPAQWLGDYDLHLAHQAELLTTLVDRRKRLPGALPFDPG